MLQLSAAAKLNLTLDITGKRCDGYHTLETIMVGISLADKLVVQKRETGIAINGINAVEHKENLCYLAARLFFEHTATKGGATITLQKEIPMQAGLGGGSADAAATLVALNDIYQTKLSQKQLAELGLLLGADIPFMLYGGMQHASGIGEILSPLSIPKPLHFVVLWPEKGLGTQEMFEAFDAQDNKKHIHHTAAVRALQENNLQAFSKYAGNVFQNIAEEKLPIIKTLCNKLYDHKAVYAALTGSGSAVFGLFETQQQALLAQNLLEKEKIVPFCRYVTSIL